MNSSQSLKSPTSPIDEVKVVEEERIDEATGRLIKIIRKIALKKIHTSVSRSVSLRLGWKKFGKAKNHPPGPEISTTIIGEEVFLSLTRDRNLDAEKKPTEGKAEAKLTCRSCGGDHWTSKCPFKSFVGTGEGEEQKTNEETQAAIGSGRYVPPSLRFGAAAGGKAGGGLPGARDDTCTVRITNLSQFTTEKDLHELLRNAGNVTRMYLAKDFETGQCKGYAFVSFTYRDEAQNAISILNGHGFGNLIIKCEFAKER